MVKDGKTNLSEKRLDDISKQLTKMDANLNQNLEQMNEYLKYISYAAIIWILLIFSGSRPDCDYLDATKNQSKR